MAFLSALNISASGMTAERMRLDVASENISNLETTRTEDGGPYKRSIKWGCTWGKRKWS